MTAYLALLRGINVSGQKMIKMDHLKSIFEAMQFQHVRTYIQSGNVVFQSADREPEALGARIEQRLKADLGYEIPVVVRTIRELEAVIAGNPFRTRLPGQAKNLYVSFLSREPEAGAIEKLPFSNGADELQIVNREVYLLCPDGYGKTPFSNSFLESKLGVSATTRNWNTLNKLVELSKID